MDKDEYIKKISKAGNRYGDKLVELMIQYNKNNLAEITTEEAAAFWNTIKDQVQSGDTCDEDDLLWWDNSDDGGNNV